MRQTALDTMRTALTRDWQSMDTLVRVIEGFSRNRLNFVMRQLMDNGEVQRRKGKDSGRVRYLYRLASSEPFTDDEPKPNIRGKFSPIPPRVTHLSPNGRDWYRATTPPETSRYARTDGGKYYRRIRDADVSDRNPCHWRSVTKAHVDHMASLNLWDGAKR